MKPSEPETVTFRLPRHLKLAIEADAATRGMTLTAVVHEALESAIGGRALARRVVLNPGTGPDFDKFLAVLRKRGESPIVLVLVESPDGRRYFFEGQIDLDLTDVTLVAVGRLHGRRPWIVPRRDVVGWRTGNRAKLNALAMALEEQGWSARTDGAAAYVAER